MNLLNFVGLCHTELSETSALHSRASTVQTDHRSADQSGSPAVSS